MPKKPAKTTAVSLLLNVLRTDGGTQPRVQIDGELIEEYTDAILNDGAEFPPVIVFYDGTDYWLADGFHRFRAHEKAKKKRIAAEIRQGTRRDAVLFAAGANVTHGKRRTNEDKRNSIETLLRDEEWTKWSDRQIARICVVSADTVGKYREILSVDFDRCATVAPTANGRPEPVETRKFQRGGKTHTMTVAERPAKPVYEICPHCGGTGRIDKTPK